MQFRCKNAKATLVAYAGLKGNKEKRKILEDEKKLHGTVDESSSEQRFCKSDVIIPFYCEKSPSASGSYGRQADSQTNCYKILYGFHH